MVITSEALGPPSMQERAGSLRKVMSYCFRFQWSDTGCYCQWFQNSGVAHCKACFAIIVVWREDQTASRSEDA